MPIPPKFCDAHIVPSLKNGSLICIGKFCDEGYVAIVGKRHLHIAEMETPPQTKPSRYQQIEMQSKAITTLQMGFGPCTFISPNPSTPEKGRNTTSCLHASPYLIA